MRDWRLTIRKLLVNPPIRVWVGLGLPPRRLHVLTVRGRRSGRVYSTPVSVMEHEGWRWLVSPYGERGWVKNARAAGEVVLRRGRRRETVAVREEVDPAVTAPVLRLYLTVEPITASFFTTARGAPLEEFMAEAHRHPVFRIRGPEESTSPERGP